MRVSRLIPSLAAFAFVAGCGAAPGAAGAGAGPAGAWPAEATPERIAEGKMLFHTGSCAQCHAANGDGGTRGPPLSDKSWLQGNGSFQSILALVREGIPLADMVDNSYRQPMPARGGDRMNLTDEQLLAVASYVYSISHVKPAGTE